VSSPGTGRKDSVVVKIGGGLTAVPDALDTACAAMARLGRRLAVIVVPGGGPLADGVRDFQRRIGASADAAHWMAILAMEQFAHVLVERIEGATLVEEPGGLGPVLETGGVAVLAAYRWMRAADVLPHSWNVTSDSIAAFVAGAVEAGHLVLIKPMAGEPAELVDSCFASVLPAGLPWTVVAWDRLEDIERRLP
jgi:5-(aminomethyl)-3-furanmethanol phosphate kinase